MVRWWDGFWLSSTCTRATVLLAVSLGGDTPFWATPCVELSLVTRLVSPAWSIGPDAEVT